MFAVRLKNIKKEKEKEEEKEKTTYYRKKKHTKEKTTYDRMKYRAIALKEWYTQHAATIKNDPTGKDVD